MRIVRGLGRWALVGPLLLTLLAVATVEFGADGSRRPTAFPIILTVADPFLRDAARDTVLASALAASLAMIVGIGLARIGGRRRFWGRPLLLALALASAAVPPAIVALGVRDLTDRALATPDFPEAWRPIFRTWAPWAGWIVVGLTTGAPWVALASGAALRGITPSWEDSARIANVSGGRIWRTLVWPLVRPATAGAAAGVFARMLADPGPPIVLGLRRSLPFQAVEAIQRADAAPRAAAIALALLAISLFVRMLVAWWGGPERLPKVTGGYGPTRPAGRLRGLVAAFTLIAWTVVALGPTFAWIAGNLELSLASWSDRAAQSRPLALSAGLGLVAALACAWLVDGRPRGQIWRLATACPMALILGAGLLANRLPPDLWGPNPAEWLGPDPTATLAVAWATIAGLIATAHALATPRRGESSKADADRSARTDAARLAGLSRGRARRLGRREAQGGLSGPDLLLLATLAATGVAPGLVLATSPDSRPAAATALQLASKIDPTGRRQAATLAALGVAANLGALALAARGRGRLAPAARSGGGPI